jgi:hypothetical protein
MFLRVRLVVPLLVPLLSGCALALGATSAHPGAIVEEARGIWTPIGGGWERLTGAEGPASSWPIGVQVGQKYMRLEGGLDDRDATAGLGGDRHVDVTLALWHLGFSVAYGKFDQWVDYQGGFRMAWTGSYWAPRLSVAPLGWASVYGGYAFLTGDDVTLGYVEDAGWAQTAFNGSERDAFGTTPAKKGNQAFAGADVTIWRWGRGKVGVKVEYQRTQSDAMGLAGAESARFKTSGLGGEIYFGSF